MCRLLDSKDIFQDLALAIAVILKSQRSFIKCFLSVWLCMVQKYLSGVLH